MTGVVEFPKDGHSYSADEVGRALAGLIRRDPDGSPREGMLAVGPTVTAVPAMWKVQVGVFSHVQDVSGAIRLGGLSAAEQVDITPASGIPAGQARIDLIVWDPDDAVLVVVDGTPATSPAAPADGGLVPVAEVRVNAGDGSVIQGQITPVYALTALAGGDGAKHGVVAKRTIPRGGSVSVPVVLPAGVFTAPPVVHVSLWGGVRDCNVTYDNVTAEGFTVVLGSNSVVDRVGGASWSAFPA